jgi:hypothetical protein
MSTTSGTVAARAQSRCSSHAMDTQPIGCACLDNSLQPRPVRLRGRPAHSIDHRENFVGLAERVESRERQAHLGPQRCHNQLFSSRRLDCLAEIGVLTGVDLGLSISTKSERTSLSSGIVGGCPLATLTVERTIGRSYVLARRATETMFLTSRSRSIDVIVWVWLGW